jgi:hypothetical protein
VTEELFSGWAPDAPIDDSLLRRTLFALTDRGSFLHDRFGFPEERNEVFAAIDTGSTVVFDNYATLLQPPSMIDLDDAIQRIASFFPPERPFLLASAWHLGDLSSTGLRLMGHPPLMFRPAGGVRPPIPAELRIEEIVDDEGARAFARTLQDAYPMPGEPSPAFDERLLGGPIRLFLGYEGDRPVSTAGVFLGHGVNDVEWVSTMPDCRGQGYGAAVTWSATRADPTLPAVLIASDDGFPVYRRMGYESLLRLTIWFRTPV